MDDYLHNIRTCHRFRSIGQVSDCRTLLMKQNELPLAASLTNPVSL